MDVKKSKKADLENKKGLFLEIGLCIALVAVIGLFAYSQSEKKIDTMGATSEVVATDMQEITRHDPKPEPARVERVNTVMDVISIVRNDAQITTDVNFADFSEDFEVVAPVVAEVTEEAVQDDAPVIRVETMPSFQGGTIDDFRNWVQRNLVYPPLAQEMGVQGRVMAYFVIEKDGTLSNIEIMQSPDPLFSAETTRVLKTSPKWEPGRQRTQAVRVFYYLPVDFKIGN